MTEIRHDDSYLCKCMPQKSEGSIKNRIPEIFQAVTAAVPREMLSLMYAFRGGQFLSFTIFDC